MMALMALAFPTVTAGEIESHPPESVVFSAMAGHACGAEGYRRMLR